MIIVKGEENKDEEKIIAVDCYYPLFTETSFLSNFFEC